MRQDTLAAAAEFVTLGDIRRAHQVTASRTPSPIESGEAVAAIGLLLVARGAVFAERSQGLRGVAPPAPLLPVRSRRRQREFARALRASPTSATDFAPGLEPIARRSIASKRGGRQQQAATTAVLHNSAR